MVSCDAGGHFIFPAEQNIPQAGNALETLFCRPDREQVDHGVTGTRCTFGPLHTWVNLGSFQGAHPDEAEASSIVRTDENKLNVLEKKTLKGTKYHFFPWYVMFLEPEAK